MQRICSLFLSLAACGLLLAGCGPQAAPPVAEKKLVSSHDDHGHDHGKGEAGHSHADGHEHGPGHVHGAGPHKGTIADWGGGKFHVEFVVDHTKQEATVYILGSDEKTPTPVKTADDSLLLTITEPAFQVTLKAAPLEGEADGKSSRFVGTHENLAKEQDFAGSIAGEVDGTPYTGDFKEEAHGDHDHEKEKK